MVHLPGGTYRAQNHAQISTNLIGTWTLYLLQSVRGHANGIVGWLSG